MNSLRTVKYLCQHLKFESLPDFKDRKIEIDLSDKSFTEKLKYIIEENVAFKLIDHKSNNIEKVIDKYGYLDLTYSLEEEMELSNRIDGLNVLKEYGILQKPQKESTEEERNEERELFEIWFNDDIEDMKSGKLFFKLFGQVGNGLQDWNKIKYKKTFFGQFKAREIHHVEFIVKEACITNFKGIWSSRYLYI